MAEYEPAIYRKFPELRKTLARVPITTLPTPARKMESFAAAFGLGELWIKRDDLCSRVYGGNKPRKLEYIIADAKQRGFDRLLAMGGIGSNFCLATTIFAARNGLKTVLALFPQQVTDHVKKSLRLYHHFGAGMELARSMNTLAPTVIYAMFRYGDPFRGRFPYFIPMGGSSPLGTIGYVDAGLELAEQVRSGAMPEPEYVFCAVGSGGTMAGLMIGLGLGGLKTRAVGIDVTEPLVVNHFAVSALANGTLRLLRRLGADIPPRMLFLPHQVDLSFRYWGGEYGKPTPAGEEAVQRCLECEGLKLDSTYTGKCLAGLIGEAKRRKAADKPLLFLNSFNSADLGPNLQDEFDYHALPAPFHKFFEQKN